MTAEILGRGIHDNRRAMLERTHQQGRRGIVDDQRNSEVSSDRGNFADREYGLLRFGNVSA